MTNQSQVAAQPISSEAKKVLDFWLQQNTKPFWFAKDGDFDKTLLILSLAQSQGRCSVMHGLGFQPFQR